MIPQQEVADLRAAFAANPADLGVGLYNPGTGEIHVASFDRMAPGGHADLATQLRLTPLSDWRGFVVSSDGQFLPASHLNKPAMWMAPADAAAVEAILRKAGLVK